MVIYLVRHGETDWNRQNRLQGKEDIELNENGIRQSAECADVFAGVPIGCILTSPLKRARKTAEIIAEKLGVSSVIVEQGLTERDFGRLSGLTPEERQAFLNAKADPCAQPLEEVIEQFMSVLDRYVRRGECRNIMVVSHGASINAVLLHLSGGRFGTGMTTLKNACISKVECDGGRMDVVYYNLTPNEFSEGSREP
jgi:broad specificity phosphatase PhoE